MHGRRKGFRRAAERGQGGEFSLNSRGEMRPSFFELRACGERLEVSVGSRTQAWASSKRGGVDRGLLFLDRQDEAPDGHELLFEAGCRRGIERRMIPGERRFSAGTAPPPCPRKTRAERPPQGTRGRQRKAAFGTTAAPRTTGRYRPAPSSSARRQSRSSAPPD